MVITCMQRDCIDKLKLMATEEYYTSCRAEVITLKKFLHSTAAVYWETFELQFFVLSFLQVHYQ